MDRPTLTDVESYVARATREAAVVEGLDPATPLRPIRRVGIIGAGTMGGGIAMNFATAGIPVTIVETAQEALDRGIALVRKNYQNSADKGRFPQAEVEARMARITPALDLEALADCDLIIEAVFENMDLKKQIFARLDAIARPGAILATNTSALDVDEIASATSRPRDVIGLHFFSPANVMKLLEIVRADQTADDVVATSMDLAGRIGKVPVLVGVCYGFVGNRMLAARREQANKLLYRGLMPWDIDAAITGFGFKMGPYQMSDLAGLDIGWSKGAKTANPIRDALCEKGRRGQKTGGGFYDYDAARNGSPSEEAAAIIHEITGAAPATLPPEEIVEMLMAPMVNEAVKILEENKAQRPSDVDVVWLNGYGFPASKGGPMYWADQVGAARILARMEALGADDPAFAPAESLRRLAAEGGRFLDLDLGGLKTGEGLMDLEFTTTRREGNILVVTMNRPDVYNAVHAPMHHEMSRIWDAFEADPELWVAVLTGAGDKAFCAGNDLKYTAQGGNMKGPETGFSGLSSRIDRLKPIVAAVNGFAMGGGFETALACDVIIASEKARFALPEVKVGFFAAAGGIQRLSREIPRKQAVEMFLTGRQVGAEEGARMGFVNEVVAPERLMDRAMEVAGEIAAVSPSSIRASLRVLRAMDDMDNLQTSLRYSRQVMSDLRETEDFREGVTAFVEKRKPNWVNR